MCVNQDIAARHVKYNYLSKIQSICLELHLRKRKWLVVGIYKPPSYSEDAFIKSLVLLTLQKSLKIFYY